MLTSKKAKAPKAAKTAKKSSPEPHHPIAKRYIFMALGVVVVISLIFIWYSATQNSTTLDETEDLPSYEELTTNDTDGDGIEDWRELLMGTNPLAYDTNGDGVGDDVVIDTSATVLSTVELNRLRAEYPDATDEELIAISRAENDPANLNVTERLSRDLYVAGEVLDRMGLLTDDVKSGISEEYINTLIYEYTYPLRISTDFDISTSPSRSDSVLYLENVFAVINDTSYLEQDALLILENALDAEDQTLLEKALDPQLLRQATTINTLETMSIPTQFLKEHEDLVNALVRVAVDTSDIQRFFEDPMRGYAATLRYQANLSSLQLAMETIGQAGITYADREISSLSNQ